MLSRPHLNVAEFGFLPGQKVVDLGSGAGHYTAALSFVLGPKGRVIAVDMSRGSLERLIADAKESSRENVEVVQGNIEKKGGTKLRDGVADGAVFTNILTQLSDVRAAIAEGKRVVKPGGKICVVEWVRGKKPVTEDDAKALFERAGLMHKRSWNAGENHYGLIFKKPLQ